MNPILLTFLAAVCSKAAWMFPNGSLLAIMMKLDPAPIGFDPNVISTYALR